MTDQNPNEPPPPPGGDPFGHEPHGDANGTAGADGNGAAGADGAAKGREWLGQLETMINDITTQAAPVARQVAAKAAELTAVAAIKAGPFAQRAANVTTDASQKLADRANTLAAELRGEIPAEDVTWADAAGATDDAADAPPAATFEDATSSEDDTPAAGTI